LETFGGDVRSLSTICTAATLAFASEAAREAARSPSIQLTSWMARAASVEAHHGRP
jgi:hypothetical protein